MPTGSFAPGLTPMPFMTHEAARGTETPELGEAVTLLARFLGVDPLTAAIASLERDLVVGRPAGEVGDMAAARGISPALMVAAQTTCESLGRLNDLIHAAGIVLALPHLLEDGETIAVRPSLAAGNDPRRRFDLETDRRVAEFKLARWRGADAMRKRQTFKDLVMLAPDRTGRRAELFVVGPEPARFLRTSRATAAWALDRTPHARRMFEDSFGTLELSVAQFTERYADHVRIVDLCDVLPPAVEGAAGGQAGASNLAVLRSSPRPGDRAGPGTVRARTLVEEVSGGLPPRIVNLTWIEAMFRHGYKGDFELAAIGDCLFGCVATACVLADWMFGKCTRDLRPLTPPTESSSSRPAPGPLQGAVVRLLLGPRGMWEKPDPAVAEGAAAGVPDGGAPSAVDQQ